MKSFRVVASSICVALFGGCTVGPNYTPPSPALPDSWSMTDHGGLVVKSAKPELSSWWKTLSDPLLDTLIDRAVAQNLDVRIAQSRVREARAQRGVVAADRAPTLDVGGSYSRRHSSANAFDTGPGAGSAGRESDLYEVGFDAGWEIDVFGGVRRSVEAAEADIDAVHADQRDVLITLLAEVARNYVELRSVQRRLVIARENIDSQRQTVDISQSRFDAGLVSELDVTQAKAQLATTQSQIPALEIAIEQSMNALSVLLGLQPHSLEQRLALATPIPQAPPEVPVGLPSELLRRRPDIRRAERELAAATARIGVATADLFPKFTLTGSLGLSSEDASNLFSSGSRTFGVGPSVTWPLFAGGRIRASIAVRNAQQEQAAANYERAVLRSLQEVENALVAFWKEQTRRDSLALASASNRRAVELANELYARGLGDFLRVLESQRSQFASDDELVRSDQNVIGNYIALYKALGGGWEAFEMADATSSEIEPVQ